MDTTNRNLYGTTSWALLGGVAGTFIAIGALASLGLRHPDPIDAELDEGHVPGSRRRPLQQLTRTALLAQSLNQGAKGIWDVAIGGADLVRKEAKMVRGETKMVRQLSGSLRGTGESLRGLGGTLNSLGRDLSRTASTLGATLGETTSSVGGKVGQTAGTVGSSVGSLGGVVTSSVGSVGGAVSSGVGSVGGAVGSGVGAAGGFVRATLSLLFWMGLTLSVLFYLYVPDTRRRERVLTQVRGFLDRNRGEMGA